MLIEVDQTLFNRSTRTFSVEASDVGLTPGKFPKFIDLQSAGGLEARFDVQTLITFKGELAGIKYTNASTLSLKIFNN